MRLNEMKQNLLFVKRISQEIVTHSIILKGQLCELFFTEFDLVSEKYLQLFLK